MTKLQGNSTLYLTYKKYGQSLRALASEGSPHIPPLIKKKVDIGFIFVRFHFGFSLKGGCLIDLKLYMHIIIVISRAL